MDKKLNAQITVFLSLILAIILSLICTTLESLRIQGIRYKLDLATDSALDSVFSEFEPDLWKKYGLLSLDAGYGSNYLSTDKIMEEYERYMAAYYNPTLPLISNVNFYNMSGIMSDIVDIKTITEEGGVFFETEVIDYMKYKEIGNLVNSLLEKINIFKNGDESKDSIDEIIGDYDSIDWEKYSEKLDGDLTAKAKKTNPNYNYSLAASVKSSSDNINQTKKLDRLLNNRIANNSSNNQNNFNDLIYSSEKNILEQNIATITKNKVNVVDKIIMDKISTLNPIATAKINVADVDMSLDVNNTEVVAVTNEDIDKSIKESIIEQIKSLSSTPILLLTCPDSVDISVETLDSEKQSRLPSVVDIDTSGSLNLSIVEDTMRNVLYNEYVLDKFKNITSKKQNEEGLKYEVEYILSGQSSDKENLESVVNKILLIREGMNALSILKDSVKMEEALTMATAIIGWSCIPVLITVVQFLLVAAWAYGESIIDMRTMLDNGKVPIIKSTTEWNLSLEGLIQLVSGRFVEGKKSNDGLSYKDYVRILLFLETSKKKYYRTMDMVQLNIQKINENFYLNQCIYSMQIDTLVSARTGFLSVPMSQNMISGRRNYFIINSTSRTY